MECPGQHKERRSSHSTCRVRDGCRPNPIYTLCCHEGSRGNVIVIDEPNSFLHPRAAKALIGILKEDRSNQYVISTHSPEIIVSSDPDRFFSLKFSDEMTSVTDVARSDLVSIKQVLGEVGAQLSDVFGADSVLWVEGPTEVQCFPLLLRAAGRALDSGLTIAPLRSTGDLESRHGAVVADIYRNLSSAHTILPTAVGVSLDGDKRGIKEKENLERAFGSILHFLKRRCYENYLGSELINLSAPTIRY